MIEIAFAGTAFVFFVLGLYLGSKIDCSDWGQESTDEHDPENAGYIHLER